MRIAHLSTFLIFFLPFSLLAQQITGVAQDDQTRQALPYATIRLYAAADSSLAGGALTDESGAFVVEAVKPGNYFLKIEALSYEPHTVWNLQVISGNDLDLGTIPIEQGGEELEEVVIQAEKSSMQMMLDKKIFNVGKDLANSGGNASDILNNIPSVSVDVEGNVSLRGTNNVRILIDGKPSGLMSFNGADGLRQLQGSQIERVEIITNPSARYEAEGVGGVINIVLKKERTKGFNGSFDIITGYPANYGAAVNLNYRQKRLNFFINYGITYRNSPGGGNLYQENYTDDTTFIYRQTNDRNRIGLNNNIRGGLDYFFTPKDILTAAYSFRRSNGKHLTTLKYYDYLFTTDNATGISVRTQDENEIEPNAEYSLNFKHEFGRQGHEWNTQLQVIDNWEDSDQNFLEKRYNPDFTPNGEADLVQHSYNFETEKQFLLQSDYVHPFGKDGKLEAGIRSNIRTMTNNYLVEDLVNGVWINNPNFTNDFTYQENIHAIYGIAGNKVKKFSYQLGVRGEWTDVTTTLEQTNEVNPRKYANLFPSAHLTYDLPAQNALQISYSRRVRRPRYRDLSPFFTFTDNRNYWSGNPNLSPEFTDSYEIGHIKYMDRASISSSLYYRHTTGKIERIRRVDENGFAATRPENLSTEDAYGAEFTSAFTPYKWWKFDANFNFFRAITDGGNLGPTFQSDTYQWFSRATSRFTLWKNTDVQMRANYESARQTTQGSAKPTWFIDLALSKDVLNNNGTITLNVSDVFNTRKWRSTTIGDNFYSTSSFQWRTRQINLTFNYRLHQQKKREDRKGDGEGGDF